MILSHPSKFLFAVAFDVASNLVSRLILQQEAGGIVRETCRNEASGDEVPMAISVERSQIESSLKRHIEEEFSERNIMVMNETTSKRSKK